MADRPPDEVVGGPKGAAQSDESESVTGPATRPVSPGTATSPVSGAGRAGIADAAALPSDAPGETFAEAAVADGEAVPAEAPAPSLPARILSAFPALSDALRIGEVGRQQEIVPVQGPLAIGVSDTELDFFTAEPFEVRACSTRGASHRHVGTPRQDAFCLGTDDDWLAICVADGVSQGRHSQVAAETAARAACKLALDGASDLPALDWTALANRVSRRILDEARYRRLVDLSAVDDPAEQIRTVRQAMSTTAVVALVARRPHLGGFPFVVAVLAGDSGAYVVRNGRFAVLAGGKDPDGTGIADGSVHPLPGPADPVVVTSTLMAGEALMLTSDGVGDPIGDGSGDVGEELARRWQKPPTAAQLFTDINFLRRSYDDDRTAVGVWVLPEVEVAR